MMANGVNLVLTAPLNLSPQNGRGFEHSFKFLVLYSTQVKSVIILSEMW